MFRIAAKSSLRCLLACLSLASAIAAVADVPVRTLNTDLRPLIQAAIGSPTQFAVLVPHAASTLTAGSWSTAAGRATWSYAVRVPSAISMSFHAIGVSLPDSATLVVRGGRSTVSYRARDLKRGELWSRIQPGDGLQFELSIAPADRSAVSLSIVSVQAGYRSLGAGIQDHPYYRAMKARAAAAGNAGCVTNYECEQSI